MGVCKRLAAVTFFAKQWLNDCRLKAAFAFTLLSMDNRYDVVIGHHARVRITDDLMKEGRCLAGGQ